MATPLKKRFEFFSTALPGEPLTVVQFHGAEGLSKLYRFQLTLVSDNYEIDLEKVIQNRAVFTILRPEGDIVFHGIVTEFEQKETVLGKTTYQAVLVPMFWRHTLTQHNQVFLGQTAPEIIEGALKDVGMTSLDYEFRLSKTYPKRDYVCQYNESHFNFITRWIEHEGMYFFFEQGESQEKLIVTDTALAHTAMKEGRTMAYSPPSGLDDAVQDEIITSLVCRQGILPARVLLKDFNYTLHDMEMTSEAAVAANGVGDVYIYGEHFLNQEEGDYLAQVRAQELQCRAQTFHGESLVPYLRPGYTFAVTGHNRESFNASYLTTDLEHHGSQVYYLTGGLGDKLEGREEGPGYRNSFSAIPSGIQFRPERIATRPRSTSTLHAHIDAAGTGKYAELDDQGRYKVRLPFDLNNSGGGKASHWLRMAQPYAGSGHGMHFPLHKGTEVLLVFIDGDVDRPVIAAAVPNPVTASPVTSANNTQSRITTSGGNLIHIEDKKGSERVLLQSPKASSFVRLGAVNLAESGGGESGGGESGGGESGGGESGGGESGGGESGGGESGGEKKEEEGEMGVKIFTSDSFGVEASNENTILFGEKNELTLGLSNEFLIGTEMSAKLAAAVELFWGLGLEVRGGTKIEEYFSGLKTFAKEGELTGTEEIVIQAVGKSPAVWPYVLGISATTVAATTACILAAQLGKSETAKKIADGCATGVAGLVALFASPVFQKLVDTSQGYKAKIELSKNAQQKGEIEITSDEFTQVTHGEWKATVEEYSLTSTGKGTITFQDNVTFGVAGAAKNLNATVSGKVNAVVTGDTAISSANTTINSTTKTSLGVGQAFLTMEGTKIASGSDELKLDGVQTATLSSSTGEMSLSAGTNMKIAGTAGVSITSGGTINIGAPGTTVVVPDMATGAQLQAQKAALEAQLKAAAETLNASIEAEQIEIQALKAKVDAIAEVPEPYNWPSGDPPSYIS